MDDFPTPRHLKQLRSFLGLASYWRFIPKFSQVAAPLYVLTKKDALYQWTPTCQDTFDELKQKLTQAPVLAFPDFSKSFILETDASGSGLGAVLAQEQEDGMVKPICYASRTLQTHEKNYGVSELEALAVVWVVKHFRVYLYGHKCKVYTDHEALMSLMNTPHPSGKLARWRLALQELDLTIHYCPGKLNQSADSSSRSLQSITSCEKTSETAPHDHEVPAKDRDATETYLLSVADRTAVQPTESHEGLTLREQQLADPELATVIKYIEDGVLPTDDKTARELILGKTRYAVIDNVLYHLSDDKSLCIVVPQAERYFVFKEVHQGRFAGHLCDAKIHSQLSKTYWWPHMSRDITS